MATTHFRTLRRTIAATVIAASAVVLTPGLADARIRADERAESSVSLNCGYLQDRWDYLARQLAAAPTQAQYDMIFGQMKETLRQWNLLCRGDYGSIMFRTVGTATTSLATAPVVMAR